MSVNLCPGEGGQTKRKAIGLLSGGLDSFIAHALIKRQGLEVVALYFLSPFWKRNPLVLQGANDLGIPVREIFLGEEYLSLIAKPKYGYGKNLNPCIDCKILMLKKAKEVMEAEGASLVFTGEVLGQRPKSQLSWSLRVIEKESGLDGRLLRPLSAQHLPPTIPEQEGWINRDQLLALSGRSRKAQLALAEQLGIKNFSSPAGGCLLTDAHFSYKTKDLIDHQQLSLDNVILLRWGRHFRLTPEFKLIVGRDQKENQEILSLLRPGDFLFLPQNGKGPVALGRGAISETEARLSAQIVARYSRFPEEKARIEVKVYPKEDKKLLEVKPLKDEDLEKWRI